MILLYLIVIIHYLLVFSPFLIFFIPVNVIKMYFKFYFLFLMLLPIHWALNKDKCFLSDIEKKLDKNNKNENFSRKHLKWFYNPIMILFGLDWNNDNDLDKMVYIHWGFNYILLWVYLFYIHKCKLI